VLKCCVRCGYTQHAIYVYRYVVLPVESVPAGNIVCIFGLQEHVLKSSTLCSTPLALPMKAITFQTKPMLRVAVEPKNHYNLRDLEAGLQQLYQYDPVVEVSVAKKDEHDETYITRSCFMTLII
jgi:translation elongation factor EF-G